MDDVMRVRLNYMGAEAQAERLGDCLFQGIGNEYYVDPVNGSDANDGLTIKTPKFTLTAGYALLTANQNDTLYIVGGASSLVLAAAFTWSKSYTHLVGLAGPVRFGGRSRIGHAGTAMSPMFTISGNGCMFKNIHFQHGQASATNLICVDISGLRNYFEGCHFEASLDTTASGGSYAWRAVKLESAAQANSFRRCTFGTWTRVWASASGVLLLFDGDNADTHLDDCVFIANTSSTSMKLVDFTGPISGGQSMVVFQNCLFIATNSAPAVVFGKPTNGFIILKACGAANCTAWGATNTSLIEINGAASASGTGIGAAQS